MTTSQRFVPAANYSYARSQLARPLPLVVLDVWLALGIVSVAACGRSGFEPLARDAVLGDGSADSAPSDTSSPSDAAPADAAQIACVDRNIGSMVGAAVAIGTTTGKVDDYAGCSGDAPDETIGWFAPATAMFRFDLCASSYDTVLSVRAGGCAGAEIACGNDECGLQSRVDINLNVGEAVVIIIDGDFSSDNGNYSLAITQL